MSTVDCDYCGLPVPGTARADDTGPRYCCYGCVLAARITRGGGQRSGRALTLLGIAIFLSMNVMVVNWMLYGQEVYNPDGRADSTVGDTTVSIFRYLSMLLSAPVLVILGWPIAASGVANLRQRRINAEVLIALGVASAFVYSYMSVMRGAGSTYFDTVCMILVLMTIGKYLEATARRQATQAIASLDTLLPGRCTVRRGDELVEIPTEELRVGEQVWVRPGVRFPADGCLLENATHANEQLLTGEGAAVEKNPGDGVFAGSINIDGAVAVRVEAVGAETLVGGMARLLEGARASRGRYQRLADRVASVFVPGVVLLAIGVSAWSWQARTIDEALLRGLSILLIACPCALGLATPLAVWVALSRAAGVGALFREVTAMERLANVKTIFFDKTGTLTTGTAEVSELVVSNGDTGVERDVLSAAAGLAQGASHHLAAGIAEHARRLNARPRQLVALQTVPGRGVRGEDPPGGAEFLLGSPAFVTDGAPAVGAMQSAVERITSSGVPLACVGWQGRMRGVFAFRETLRPQCKETIEELQSLGIDLAILTGDHAQRGRQLAEELGVRVESQLLPADKIARIAAVNRRLRPVAMVGDGINDAPALAAADVGVAMGCGADIARNSADVCLMGDELAVLPWLVRLARKTARTIRVNLAWAFAYNVVGLWLAATGRLTPVFAALAMVASSLFVVFNSLRLKSGASYPVGMRELFELLPPSYVGGSDTGIANAAAGGGGVTAWT